MSCGDGTLKGKVSIVTGGGSGIGKAIALALARRGSAVAAWDIVAEQATRVSEDINGLGVPGLGLCLDVSNRSQVQTATHQVLDAFGKIDILVNDAGIAPQSWVWDMAEEEWDRVLAVNLKSVFLCTQAVSRTMMAQRQGRIVAITSDYYLHGGIRRSHYCASKAGIVGLVKGLAMELGPYGITANAIAPGITDTPLVRRFYSDRDLATKAQENIMGRLGRPDDIAGAVLFLASEEASWVNGQVFSVNGGGQVLPFVNPLPKEEGLG